MPIIIIIFGILFLLGCSFIKDGIKTKKSEDKIFGSLLILIGISVLSIFILEYGGPKAIDVYRGKTTLKITYKDSIPIDSVVVYKNEKRLH